MDPAQEQQGAGAVVADGEHERVICAHARRHTHHHDPDPRRRRRLGTLLVDLHKRFVYYLQAQCGVTSPRGLGASFSNDGVGASGSGVEGAESFVVGQQGQGPASLSSCLIVDPAQEEEGAGAVVADDEQERVVGTHGWNHLVHPAADIDGDSCCGRRLGTLLVHLYERLMYYLQAQCGVESPWGLRARYAIGRVRASGSGVESFVVRQQGQGPASLSSCRIVDTAQEEQGAGAVVADGEEERVVGAHGWNHLQAMQFDADSCGCRRLGTLLVHLYERLMYYLQEHGEGAGHPEAL